MIGFAPKDLKNLNHISVHRRVQLHKLRLHRSRSTISLGPGQYPHQPRDIYAAATIGIDSLYAGSLQQVRGIPIVTRRSVHIPLAGRRLYRGILQPFCPTDHNMYADPGHAKMSRRFPSGQRGMPNGQAILYPVCRRY